MRGNNETHKLQSFLIKWMTCYESLKRFTVHFLVVGLKNQRIYIYAWPRMYHAHQFFFIFHFVVCLLCFFFSQFYSFSPVFSSYLESLPYSFVFFILLLFYARFLYRVKDIKLLKLFFFCYAHWLISVALSLGATF